MITKMFLIIFVACSLLFVLTACVGGDSSYKNPEVGADTSIYIDTIGDSKYVMVVEGFDWGPGVPKIIVNLGESVAAADITTTTFTVTVEYMGTNGATEPGRTITNAYVSDINGNEVSTDSQYVTIEMTVHPDDLGSRPFTFSMADFRNTWADPYNHTISSDTLNIEVTELEKRIMPLADHFINSEFTHKNITLHYGHYSPAEDSGTNSLIIWLHGAGEGGTDPHIVHLGNKVVNLITEDIQKYFSEAGAYVLTPQSPTMWMDNGSGIYTSDGSSMYLEALMALIEAYVNGNDDIDLNRIYIGGCSNGGFMTMKMIIAHPEYFAAAFPICEALSDDVITDSDITAIKDIPIWFTHASNDPIVPPDNITIAAYNRLKSAGAENVHFSYFDNVVDTSGLYFQTDGTTPYEYIGHLSWIYTLNNECELDYDGSAVQIDRKNVTIMEWLAAQSR